MVAEMIEKLARKSAVGGGTEAKAEAEKERRITREG